MDLGLLTLPKAPWILEPPARIVVRSRRHDPRVVSARLSCHGRRVPPGRAPGLRDANPIASRGPSGEAARRALRRSPLRGSLAPWRRPACRPRTAGQPTPLSSTGKPPSRNATKLWPRPGARDGEADELRVIARAPDQAGVRGFAEGQPEPKVCSGLDESLMQVFHGLDEVGMPEDEVQGLGLLDSDCPQLHVASATASCSPWHSPASRYRRHGLPTQRPRMGRAPLAACPGSVESHDPTTKEVLARPRRSPRARSGSRRSTTRSATSVSQSSVSGPCWGPMTS